MGVSASGREKFWPARGFFGSPCDFLIPESVPIARTCFSLLTALTCSVTMLLAVYPQKPAPESGTFTHAFSPCAYCFAPNHIIRATAFRLLVEPGAGARKAERSGTCSGSSESKPQSYLRAGALSNDFREGAYPVGGTRNIWPAEFSFWHANCGNRNCPRPSRGIRPALGRICQALRNAFHGCGFQSCDGSRTWRHLGRRPALRAQSKLADQAPDRTGISAFVHRARSSRQAHARLRSIHRDPGKQFSFQHLASQQ